MTYMDGLKRIFWRQSMTKRYEITMVGLDWPVPIPGTLSSRCGGNLNKLGDSVREQGVGQQKLERKPIVPVFHFSYSQLLPSPLSLTHPQTHNLRMISPSSPTCSPSLNNVYSTNIFLSTYCILIQYIQHVICCKVFLIFHLHNYSNFPTSPSASNTTP